MSVGAVTLASDGRVKEDLGLTRVLEVGNGDGAVNGRMGGR